GPGPSCEACLAPSAGTAVPAAVPARRARPTTPLWSATRIVADSSARERTDIPSASATALARAARSSPAPASATSASSGARGRGHPARPTPHRRRRREPEHRPPPGLPPALQPPAVDPGVFQRDGQAEAGAPGGGGSGRIRAPETLEHEPLLARDEADPVIS